MSREGGGGGGRKEGRERKKDVLKRGGKGYNFIIATLL